MSLKALLDSIVALLPEGVTSAIGRDEEVNRNAAPPRVVLDFVSEAIEAPHGQGNGLPRSRWFCSRASDVNIHIWGTTLETTEELVEAVLNILQDLAPGDGHRRRGGAWFGNALSHRGLVYVLGVTFVLPVERRQTFITVAELPTAGEFIQPETA